MRRRRSIGHCNNPVRSTAARDGRCPAFAALRQKRNMGSKSRHGRFHLGGADGIYIYGSIHGGGSGQRFRLLLAVVFIDRLGYFLLTDGTTSTRALRVTWRSPSPCQGSHDARSRAIVLYIEAWAVHMRSPVISPEVGSESGIRRQCPTPPCTLSRATVAIRSLPWPLSLVERGDGGRPLSREVFTEAALDSPPIGPGVNLNIPPSRPGPRPSNTYWCQVHACVYPRERIYI